MLKIVITRRFVVLHNPEVQKKVLKEEALVIVEEARKEVIKGLSTHVQICKINLNEASVEELLAWVRSIRVLKRDLVKNNCQDTRNMLNVTVH